MKLTVLLITAILKKQIFFLTKQKDNYAGIRWTSSNSWVYNTCTIRGFLVFFLNGLAGHCNLYNKLIVDSILRIYMFWILLFRNVTEKTSIKLATENSAISSFDSNL